MKTTTRWLFISGAASLAFPAFAQTNVVAAPDQPNVHAAENARSLNSTSSRRGTLEEVVVTAQKRQENLQDVPISISVLSGVELGKSSAQGVGEALNQVPGVVATDYYGGSSHIGIRGVAAGAPYQGGASPVGYYLDSVPLNGTGGSLLPDANVYDLQRIEVMRGPQGTLYGVNSVGGLVRVLTQDANLTRWDFKGRVSAQTTDGGDGSYRGDAAINVPLIEGKLGARAVLGYQDIGGWIDSPNRKDINGAELQTYRVKLNAQPLEKLAVGVSAWSSRQDYSGPSKADEAGRLSYDDPEPMATDYDIYGFSIAYDFASFLLSSTTSYIDQQTNMLVSLTPFALDVHTVTSLGNRVISEELLVRSNDAERWKWSVGTLLRDETITYSADIPGMFLYPIRTRARSESYAIFGQFGRRFGDDKFEWALGLRSFRDRQSSDGFGTLNEPLPSVDGFISSATTPRAVLTWYPAKSITIYGSYGQGFRSGGPAPATAPQLGALHPDKLNNYELGAKADALDGRLYFDSAVYYIKWDDVQQFQTVIVQNVPYGLLRNIGAASGVGVDLSVASRPIEGVSLGLNLSWNDLKLDQDVTSITGLLKGSRLNYSSEYTAGIFAGYEFAIGSTGLRGSLSASANHISKQSYNGTAGDALSIVGASFAIASADDQWTVTLLGDNLSNERGGPPSMDGIAEWSARMRPRSIGLQIEYHL
ncbi:TonB-dependent receptor [Steroidobacter cummioxidans]|uniref:TonB-dependent receptor n=1 Tax=Steroidobacter cummioxidans TaxID=1803913 RepID=UPI00137AD0EB|nr:TonB-dependent receptor [Steroidobacter cummioxidans]